MIELERTFLAKLLPENLKECPHKDIVDMYIENGDGHLTLRIRKNGDSHKLVRKSLVDSNDRSKQLETTIDLSQTEYESLSLSQSRRVEKTRYLYPYQGHTAEYDIFKGNLAGLVVIDFEFETEGAKDAFVAPDFCLADVTQENFITGGALAGKSYEDIGNELERFGYQKLKI